MKVLFIHHKAHDCHKLFANTVTSDWIDIGRKNREIFLNSVKYVISNKDKKRYDILFLEGVPAMPYALAMKLRNPKAKIIVLSAGDIFYLMPKLNPFIYLFTRFALRYVDGIITISHLNLELLRKYYKGPAEIVFSPPIHPNFKINCNVESNKILFIGINKPMKGFHQLIDAVESLNNSGHHFELYLIGRCGENIKKRFEWLHVEGWVPDFDKYLKTCSMYVHPAFFESVGVVIFEAMSAGIIPVITENMGLAYEFRKYKLDFLILKDNKPENIAKKILEIYEKPLWWKKRMSKKVKKIARYYTKEVQLKNFKNAFRKLANISGVY
jgi:glycosyltransferase involved in cell wall biosynthesis